MANYTKFTVPCDFNGIKAPFTFYAGSPEPKHHPIEHQANWLMKERGGSVPQEVMESLAKLKELSEKNGVPFQELCDYAFTAATAYNTEPVVETEYKEEAQKAEEKVE